MIVTGVKLRNFRNHAESSVEFGPGINALLGDNGEGKTNVLEAISFLSLTKSFYASADATVVKIGAERFEVEGTIVGGSGTPNRVQVVYTRQPAEKSYEINGNRPERLASAIGRFPIVVLSPENGGVTSGGPAERRKFIDLILSQISPAYLETLLEYRQVIKQRNRVLMDFRLRGMVDLDLLVPWDENLGKLGGAIIERRRSFLAEFREYMIKAYADVAGGREDPEVSYISVCPSDERNGSTEEIAALLMRQIEARRAEEFRRGSSLVGPHRDDVGLTLNGVPVQEYASQGQHKTMLVALKVAEYHYIAERRREPPILLLDDVFSELDAHRSERILRMTDDLGQVIITATDEHVFQDAVHWNDRNRRFTVAQGTCRRITAG
jgi:DNA replication and repair protein RecF